MGLDASQMRFEYPMMAMTTQGSPRRQIRYVGVENSTIRYAQPSAPPVCMVICLNCLHAPKKSGQYSAGLARVQSFGNVVLFSRP